MAATAPVVWLALALVYAVALLAAVFAGVLSWHRRAGTTGAYPLAVMEFAVAAWCLTDLVIALTGLQVLPAAAARAALATALPLIAVVVACFWLVTRAVGDRHWTPTARTLGLLAVHPLYMAVGVAITPWTGALYTAGGIRRSGLWLDWEPGPAFWPHAGYSYLLIVWSGVNLLRSFRHAGPVERRQVGLLLLCLVVPIPGNVVTTLTASGSAPDLTAVGFTLSGLLAGYALLRHGLLDLVPVARGLVLERLADAVVVLGPDGRLVDVNRAAAALLEAMTGRPAAALPGLRDVIPQTDGEQRITLPDGRRLVLDVRVEALLDRRERPTGHVLVARDVTELVGLRDDLAERAVRDELTGLHNRRHLMATLGRALQDFAAGSPDVPDVAVVLVDIDHFKSVNDGHGHPVGDALLTAVAGALRWGAREGTDVVARIGGEEFVVMLPGMGLDEAVHRAEQLRLHCRTVTVDGVDGPLRRTISVGVASAVTLAATLGGEPVDTAGLLRAADEALYRAKTSGRDRVEAAA